MSVTSESPNYRPIGDYAAIGDCRSAALISRNGSIDWLCWPHFGSKPVFAAILDRHRGGFFEIEPENIVEVLRRYVDGTNVLETTFVTKSGVMQLTDAMTLGPTKAVDMESQRELLRIIEGVEGHVTCRIRYMPRPGFARRRPKLHAARRTVVHRTSSELLSLHATIGFDVDEDAASAGARISIGSGERHYLSLSYTAQDIGVLSPLGPAADKRYTHTVQWWQNWSARCKDTLPFADAVLRSALVLKMLAYSLSGAIVAAPTTSLPEVIGGERNWDYRFCWLRDASLTLRAFLDLGYVSEARAFLDWLLHTTRLTRPQLKVLYDVYGRSPSKERTLDHLEGYQCSRPVREGNAAAGQLQLDVYGAVCLAALHFSLGGGQLEYFEKHWLAGFGRRVQKCWREPDNGIWESRGTREHHTYSKLMCWAAADSLLALDDRVGLPIHRPSLERTREEIRDWIETQAYCEEQDSFVSRPGVEWPDASLLAIVRCGFLAPTDPRVVGTFAHIERSLARGALMLRYPQGIDGLPGREGAFGLTGFWAVDYLARCGEIDEALRRFEVLLGYANDVGLFGEEIDVASGAHLGNFPQAFTHVGVISAATSLQRAMQEHRA
jgi:GH15 family glucan-1,4-alpha-glucosidase